MISCKHRDWLVSGHSPPPHPLTDSSLSLSELPVVSTGCSNQPECVLSELSCPSCACRLWAAGNELVQDWKWGSAVCGTLKSCVSNMAAAGVSCVFKLCSERLVLQFLRLNCENLNVAEESEEETSDKEPRSCVANTWTHLQKQLENIQFLGSSLYRTAVSLLWGCFRNENVSTYYHQLWLSEITGEKTSNFALKPTQSYVKQSQTRPGTGINQPWGRKRLQRCTKWPNKSRKCWLNT